jgi:hypothetical protein
LDIIEGLALVLYKATSPVTTFAELGALLLRSILGVFALAKKRRVYEWYSSCKAFIYEPLYQAGVNPLPFCNFRCVCCCYLKVPLCG